MVFDYKKEYKEIYLPKSEPSIVTIPKMNYIAVRGQGDPNDEDDVTTVYVGKDAEEHVTANLIKMCEEKNISIKYIETMEELGKMAGIEVKSAAAAE